MNANMTSAEILEFIKGCPTVGMGGYHVSEGNEYEWGIHQKGDKFYMVEWKNGTEPQECVEVRKLPPLTARQFVTSKGSVYEAISQ